MVLKAHIVAMTEDGMIGKNNDLPWGFWKEDLQFFKDTTINSVVVMGFNTVLSLPKKLPNRTIYGLIQPTHTIAPNALTEFYSIADKLVYCVNGWLGNIESQIKDKDIIFIAGGGKTYRETLDDTDIVYQNVIIPDDKINVEQEDKIVYYPINKLHEYFVRISSQEVQTSKGKLIKNIWVRKK